MSTNTQPGALPSEGFMRLKLVTGKTSSIIGSLSQLRGHVRIVSSHDALRLVRLRTSFSTWNMWPDTHVELEIMPYESVKHIPNYGLELVLDPDRDSGYLGVLSAKAFKEGRFDTARVAATPTGFRITRWIFVTDYSDAGPKQSVELIEETVAADGSYTRVVRRRVRPPVLPKTKWTIPQFA